MKMRKRENRLGGRELHVMGVKKELQGRVEDWEKGAPGRSPRSPRRDPEADKKKKDSTTFNTYTSERNGMEETQR